MTHPTPNPRPPRRTRLATALLCLAAAGAITPLAGCGSSHGSNAANQGAETPPPLPTAPPPSNAGASAARKREEAELQKAKEAAKKHAEQEAAAAAAGGRSGAPGHGRSRRGRAHRRGARRLSLAQNAAAEKASENTARSKFQSEEAAELRAFKSKEHQELKKH